MTTTWKGRPVTGRLVLPGIDESTRVLITGGTGSIGLHAARAFLALGSKVAVMSRSAATVDAVVAQLAAHGTVLGIPGDVSSQADCDRAVGEVVVAWGGLDVLVQCAAVGGHRPLEETDAERIDTMLGVNFRGTMLMARAAARAMREGGGGRIINTSTIMAHRSTENGALYGASKAAVGHLTRALAVELGPDGITVNCVSPANTPTQVRQIGELPGAPPAPPSAGGGSAAKIPLRRRGDLDDYVGPILFYASELAAYLTGTEVLADGGLSLVRA